MHNLEKVVRTVTICDDDDPLKDYPSTLSAEARRQGGMEIVTLGPYACGWLKNNVRISSADHKNLPFEVLPWQRRMFYEMLRMDRDENGELYFCYEQCLISTAKKSGKSESAAGLALFLAGGIGIKDPEIAVAAASKDQANIIFECIKTQVESSESLNMAGKATKQLIKLSLPDNDEAKIYHVAANPETLDGKNLTAVIFDELHRYVYEKNEKTFKVLSNAGIARSVFFIISTTTAPEAGDSLCMRQFQRYERVCNGEEEAGVFWGVMFKAPEGSHIDDEESWKAANPTLGVAYPLHKIRNRRSDPTVSEDEFRRFFRNEIVESSKTWTGAKIWPSLARRDETGHTLDYVEFDEELPVICGMDLSVNRDSSAVIAVQPNPETETYQAECNIWANPYHPSDEKWKDWRVPYKEIVEYLVGLDEKFRAPASFMEIQKDTRTGSIVGKTKVPGIAVAYDPNKVGKVPDLLAEHGISLRYWDQGIRSMGPACQVLHDLLEANMEDEFGKKPKVKTLIHNNNKIMEKQMRNVRQEISKDDRYWRMVKKPGDEKKVHIDGPVALAMAIAFADMQIKAGLFHTPRAPRIYTVSL